MREHRVNLARIRGQVGLTEHVVAVIAGDLRQELFEIGHVPFNSGPELRITCVFLSDLIEGLLTLQCIEAAREDMPLTAAVAFPKVDEGLVVDRTGDIDRQRVQAFHRLQR